jgi:putative flavoprotein involved in K+ transport
MREQKDVVVIGGGQAGLAMSSVLQQQGREHIILERRRIGESWRTERWDSLRFQFPNWTIQLPDYTYRGNDPDHFAHYSEILRLVEDYAVSTGAPVRENTEALALTGRGTGEDFEVSLAEGSIHAHRVVIATGPFQRPRIPQLASDVPPSVLQLDPTRYRSPEALPAGAVLVVGSGASGCQIADELLHAGRRVYLSVSRHRRAPRRFRGRDVYWWLEALGRFAQTIDSFPARQYPPSTVVTGVNGGYNVNVRQLAADGVSVLGRVIGASGPNLDVQANANQVLDEADQAYTGFLSAARQFISSNGIEEWLDQEEPEEPIHFPAVEEVDSLSLAREGINTIIWATGYAYDFDWVKIPVFDDRGRPLQQRGVTAVPGLYFLGLHWMHTFKSGLLSGVGADAEFLADHMARGPMCPRA